MSASRIDEDDVDVEVDLSSAIDDKGKKGDRRSSRQRRGTKQEKSFKVNTFLEQFKDSTVEDSTPSIDDALLMPEASEYLRMGDAVAMVKAKQSFTEQHLIRLVDKAYPQRQVPQLRDLIDAVLHEPSSETQLYEQGVWVEILGNDMVWHLSRINSVVRQAPDSWDWDDPENFGKEPPWQYYYNVADRTLLEASSLRAPESGLRAIFGMRPWLWQQYALLKIERRLRFQKDSEHDFEEFDCQKYARDKWLSFLKESENQDFLRHFEAMPQHAQLRLIDHLLKPFELLDEMVEDQERWDFSDKDFNVYTYTSCMGGGLFVFLTVALIQLVVPIILLYASIEDDESGRYNVDQLSDLWEQQQSWADFCNSKGKIEGIMLNLLVLLIYTVKVLPETYTSIFLTAGAVDTTYSRFNSLRKVVWDQGDDTLLQQVGYKVELYMNTGYICIVYSAMVLILFNTTESVLDIVLNALAIDFLLKIDEEVADAAWYDKDNRWLRAGCLELVLQSTLRLDQLANPSLLCRNFGIEMDDLKKALGTSMSGNCKSLCDRSRASKDEADVEYMTVEDGIYLACARRAKKTNNHKAQAVFVKPIVQFDGFFHILYQIGLSGTGMFHRYRHYRTWSRWEKVLYLPEVPSNETILRLKEGEIKLDGTSSDSQMKIGTFYEQYNSVVQGFLGQVFVVLTGISLVQSVSTMWIRGRYILIPWRIFDWLIHWFMTIMQLTFPVIIAGMFVLIPACY